ncbi:hypothetical protein V4S35_10445 [Enterococcus cecorum]
MNKYVDRFWVYGSFLKQKQFWIKSFIILFVFTFMFVVTQMTHATVDGNGVNIESIVSDPASIYERYKENSFQLMTKPYESSALFGGAIEEMYNNISGTIKNMIWSAVRAVGAFNTTMVKYLFNLDLVSQVKQPFVNLTASIAQSMIGVAGTIGISIVALLMAIKFAVEQRFRSAFVLFLMTVFTFTGLAILKDVNSADSVATTILNVDKAIETSFVQVNPAFINGDKVAPSTSQTPEKQMKQAGDLIATQVFYTNVFEPYLLTNYGTSDIKKIRSKSVEYENKRYDRIQILLDNDLTTEDGKKIHEAVTDYEADNNKNKAIQYFNSSNNAIFLLFYLVVNLLQTLVYFMLSMFRNAVAFLQILFLPLAPIMLLFGLFIESVNAFKNYAKGSLILMFLKALLSFLAIIFASYLSIGFKIAQGNMDAWQKILTLIVYICLPFVLYAMRHFIFMLLVGELNGRQMVRLMTNPFAFNRLTRQQAKAYRERQNKSRQQKQETGKQTAKEKQKEAEKRGTQDLGLNRVQEVKQQQRSQKRHDQRTNVPNEKQEEKRSNARQGETNVQEGANKQVTNAHASEIPNQAISSMNHTRSQKRAGTQEGQGQTTTEPNGNSQNPRQGSSLRQGKARTNDSMNDSRMPNSQSSGTTNSSGMSTPTHGMHSSATTPTSDVEARMDRNRALRGVGAVVAARSVASLKRGESGLAQGSPRKNSSRHAPASRRNTGGNSTTKPATMNNRYYRGSAQTMTSPNEKGVGNHGTNSTENPTRQQLNKAPSRPMAPKSPTRQSGQRQSVSPAMRNQAVNRRQLGAHSTHRQSARPGMHRPKNSPRQVQNMPNPTYTRNATSRQGTSVMSVKPTQASHYRQVNRMSQGGFVSPTPPTSRSVSMRTAPIREGKVNPGILQGNNQTKRPHLSMKQGSMPKEKGEVAVGVRATLSKGTIPKRKRIIRVRRGKKG